MMVQATDADGRQFTQQDTVPPFGRLIGPIESYDRAMARLLRARPLPPGWRWTAGSMAERVSDGFEVYALRVGHAGASLYMHAAGMDHDDAQAGPGWDGRPETRADMVAQLVHAVAKLPHKPDGRE